jgi:hypothetical protein
MILFDIETLDVESTAVILSAAMVYFDEGMNFDDLKRNSIFVKFDAKEQIQKYKRTIGQSTLEWWKKQNDFAKTLNLNPSAKDVSAIEGIELLRGFLDIDPSPRKILWTRGSLDQMCIESLCNSVDIPYLVKYNQFMDVRTAITILAENSNNGYCPIYLPGFNPNQIIKHDPICDCILDSLQLLYFKEPD